MTHAYQFLMAKHSRKTIHKRIEEKRKIEINLKMSGVCMQSMNLVFPYGYFSAIRSFQFYRRTGQKSITQKQNNAHAAKKTEG